MHGVAVARVEVEVDPVQLVVERLGGGVGLDGVDDGHPVGFEGGNIRDDAAPEAGHEGVSEGSADGAVGNVLANAGDVADDLHPEPVPGAAANGDEPFRGGAHFGHHLEVVPGAERGSFQGGAEEVGGGVAERQADVRAAGIGILERGALSLEVGEADEAAGARRGVGGGCDEGFEGFAVL